MLLFLHQNNTIQYQGQSIQYQGHGKMNIVDIENNNRRHFGYKSDPKYMIVKLVNGCILHSKHRP